jgi:hypothetical protein
MPVIFKDDGHFYFILGDTINILSRRFKTAAFPAIAGSRQIKDFAARQVNKPFLMPKQKLLT